MKITFLLFAILVSLATGCANVHNYSVKLDSDPEGAHVFMASGALKKPGARDFIGTTPCTANIQGTRDGYFITPQVDFVSDFVAGVVVFTFEPPAGATNLFEHTQSYRTPTNFKDGDKIPQGIFFDLHKQPD